MRKSKRKRLEAHGWKVGTTGEFLGLSPEEAEFIELKLALANFLRTYRRDHGWTQIEVAKKVGSSQSRVAKMEVAHPSVTIDLLLRCLLALGASREEVAQIISQPAA